MPDPAELLALMPFAAARGTKASVGEPERSRLRFRDRGVVHHRRPAQRPDSLLQAGSAQTGKFRHRLQVDVKRIEEEAAAREIRARLRRPIVEQRVQRVEPDGGCAEIGRKIDESEQVGEIAMAPIAAGTYAVKLHVERPHPPRRYLPALICARVTDDERCLFGAAVGRRHAQAK